MKGPWHELLHTPRQTVCPRVPYTPCRRALRRAAAAHPRSRQLPAGGSSRRLRSTRAVDLPPRRECTVLGARGLPRLWNQRDAAAVRRRPRRPAGERAGRARVHLRDAHAARNGGGRTSFTESPGPLHQAFTTAIDTRHSPKRSTNNETTRHQHHPDRTSRPNGTRRGRGDRGRDPARVRRRATRHRARSAPRPSGAGPRRDRCARSLPALPQARIPTAVPEEAP